MGGKLRGMGELDAIVEELKALPPDRLAQAADYIHRLQILNQAERSEILRNTAGILAGERGEEFARNVREVPSR
jgi:membrane-anchored protein YejM (alkaline phosphatase superfamily)